MLQNVITLGLDNPVVLVFEMRGEFEAAQLKAFDRITVGIGAEVYSTADHPDLLFIPDDEPDHLYLKIGAVTGLHKGSYHMSIRGFNARYPNGYVLNSAKRRLLAPVDVIKGA